MEVGISLVVDCGGQKLVLCAKQSTSLEEIRIALKGKWPEFQVKSFTLRYSVLDIENCCLKDDDDVRNMIFLAQQLQAKVIHAQVVLQDNQAFANQASASNNVHGRANLNYTQQHNNTGQQFGGTDYARNNVQESFIHYVPHQPNNANNPSTTTFNGLAARAFASTTCQMDGKEIQGCSKTSKRKKPSYDREFNYPTYDVCPTHGDKPLLSDQWETIITGIGQEFPGGASDFRAELIKYATINGFKYNFEQNCKRRIYVVCDKRYQNQACPWFIRANEAKSGMGEFVIAKADLTHTCDIVPGSHDNDRLYAEFVASLIESDVREYPKMTGKDVKRLIMKSYGLDINYTQAWRALEHARDKLFGSFESSFEHLRWYLEALLKTNPGSCVELEQNKESNRFDRAFIAFKAAMDGFKHCRPMLFIDGTFMRGRWKGTILAATAKDGNDGLFPVAFAMVQGETLANWKWFLEHLRDNIKHEKPIYYISDRNTGLLSAFQEVWLKPLNFYCLVHLFNNLKSLYGKSKTDGQKIRMCYLLKRCAYAPTLRLFNIEMERFIKEGGEKAKDWIADIERAKWAVAFAPHLLRYGEMTSNAAESYNHNIKDARALPITFMVDCIRLGIMRWYVERRAAASNWTSRLTETMQNKWNTDAHTGKHWGVMVCPDGKYEVKSTPNAIVDINRKKCSCHQWEVIGFPCVHAIRVIIKHYKGIDGIVHECYFKSSYLAAYEGNIQPVPETEKFEFQNIAGLNKILPPERLSKPGRTKKKRVPSAGELRKTKPWVCSKCNKLGRHDEVTCDMSC